MFTLCGLILEARENLFRNFGSPYSISFYFSSERNNKKTNRLRAVPERDTARGQPLNSAATSSPSPSAPPDPRAPPEPPPTSPMIPQPEVRRASFSVPKKEKKRKKIGVRRFSFSRIKSAIFLIAIPGLIFVLV